MTNDLISRKEAIEAAIRESQVDGAYGYMDTKDIVDMLEDLPAAQERTGKWKIEDFHGNWEDWDICTCSVCKVRIKNLYPRHYCPNCGAQMRKETEDEDNSQI